LHELLNSSRSNNRNLFGEQEASRGQEAIKKGLAVAMPLHQVFDFTTSLRERISLQ
jgi:hypothetical protein